MDDAKLAENASAARAPQSRRVRSAALAGVGALVAVIACGDPYLHTNPYDPAVPVEFTITGPDSLFELGDFAQYSVTTVPGFADSSFVWLIDTITINKPGVGDTVVDGATVFRPSGTGGYVAIMPPLEPDVVTATVVAALGQIDTTISTPCCNGCTCPAKHAPYYRHFGYKSVVLSQHLASIRLRCPDTNVCDTVAVGGTWSVWVDGFDAHGRQPYLLTSSSANFLTGTPVAIYTVRDTTIATAARVGIRATTVTARKSGSTWIVGTHGALLDSLKLVVQ